MPEAPQESIYLALIARRYARRAGIITINADLELLQGIKRLLTDTFPNNTKLGKLPVEEAAFLLRLNYKDPRLHVASQDYLYAPVGRLTEPDTDWVSIGDSKAFLLRSRRPLVEVSFSDWKQPPLAAAAAQGMAEYAGIMAIAGGRPGQNAVTQNIQKMRENAQARFANAFTYSS